jgi:hypothetical protein
MSTETTVASPPEDDPSKERRLAAVDAAARVDDDVAGDPERLAGELTERQAQDATDWFMSAEPEAEGYMDF